MRDEVGIELVSALPPNAVPTFGTLAEWYILGGRCRKCGHESWVDRWALQDRYGKNRYLAELRPALRCRECGAKGESDWITGKVKR